MKFFVTFLGNKIFYMLGRNDMPLNQEQWVIVSPNIRGLTLINNICRISQPINIKINI